MNLMYSFSNVRFLSCFRLRRSYSEGTQRSKGMLFLIADAIINFINCGMRNRKYTKSALPNEFFLNEIVAVDIMRVATIISLETLKRL